jgi:hypothetical protein
MLKTYAVSAVIVILLLGAAAGFISCGNEASEGISLSMIFIDEYTGEPVKGVEMYLNGTTHTSGSDGTITVSTGDQALPVEGYLDLAKLYDLGYLITDSAAYIYFSFTATSSFSRTIHLAQLPDSQAGIPIAGTVAQKSGDGTVQEGYILIFTPDGRTVRGFASPVLIDGNGMYSANVPDYGSYYFIVHDTGANQVYYTVKEVQDESSDGQQFQPEAIIWAIAVHLSYDGEDIVLQGDAGDAEYVQPALMLGEEIIQFDQYSDFNNPFSFSVPHRDNDRIRLLSAKKPEDDNRYYHITPPPGYSTNTSKIDADFSAGSTVPDEWDAGISWDGESQTLNWKKAGNATAYMVHLSLGKIIKKTADTSSGLAVSEIGPGMYAFVQGTSVTFPADLNLSSVSTITIHPIWSESFVGFIDEYAGWDFMLLPADLISGTVIFYEGLTARWGLEKIIKQPVKEEN